MKLPTSEKEQTEFVKPKIRKGYYPGKFLGVKVFADKDGNPIRSKFKTHQLILEFEVWKGDENGEPIAEMTYDYGNSKTDNIKLGYFINYEKLNIVDKEEVWGSTISKNSKATKVFEALGWTFSKTEELDTEKFIGQFAVLNIDDYKNKENVTFSIIKGIGPLNPETEQKGEPVKDDTQNVESGEVKYKDEAKAKDLLERKENMTKMHKEGHLSEDGLKTALESIDSELEALKE